MKSAVHERVGPSIQILHRSTIHVHLTNAANTRDVLLSAAAVSDSGLGWYRCSARTADAANH